MKKYAVLLAVLVLLVSSFAGPVVAGAATPFRVRASATPLTSSGAPVSVKFSAKSNRSAYVRVSVYDAQGKLVRSIRTTKRAFTKNVYWNLRASSGLVAAPGTYTYRVTASQAGRTAKTGGSFTVARKRNTVLQPRTPSVDPTTTVEPTPSVDPTTTTGPTPSVDPTTSVTPTVTAPVPTPTPTPTPTPAPGRWIGYYVPGAPSSAAPLVDLQTKVGGTAKVVNFFASDTESFPWGRCEIAADNGSIPMVTVEFWSAQTAGVKAIANGSKDTYLRNWARSAKSYGGEVWIRPFHEMNGDWYPWGGTVGVNKPADTVAAYRHVYDIFAEEGATNVKFVWCVNNDSVPSTTANAIEAYWPGDAYVDYLAIDGYNFGTSSSWSSWRSFSSVIGTAYGKVTKLSAKPLFIAETGCSESGGNKAAWITDMFAKIKSTYPRIQGVTWFNADKETDWRVESSTTSLNAWKTVVKSGY